MTRATCWLAGLLLASALVAGCGQEERPPVADSPGLAVALEKIDRAVVAGRLPQAQGHLADLLATTERSREAGVLSAVEADRIEEAAAALAAALTTAAAPPPAPRPTPTQAPVPAPAPAPDDDGGSGDGETGNGGSGNDGDRGGPPPGKGAGEDKGQGRGGH